MRSRTAFAVVTVAAFGALLCAPVAFALQEKKPDAPKAEPAKAEPPKSDKPKAPEMKDMHGMEAKPGPENDALQKLAGDWTVETTMEMPGAPKDQPAMKTGGMVKIAGALGGRFVQETGSGEMMGSKFESFKMWGYNTGAKRYEAFWAWTNSTGFLAMNGESKDGGKTIEFNASFINQTGAKEEFKVTMTVIDNDHFSVKMWGGKQSDGSPGGTMMSTYTRKK